MAYKLLLRPKMMKDLWMLREYCGGPSIIQSVRNAVEKHLKEFELRIGTSIQDAAESIEGHEKERDEELPKEQAEE